MRVEWQVVRMETLIGGKLGLNSQLNGPLKIWRGQGCWGRAGAGQRGSGSVSDSVLAVRGADTLRPDSPEEVIHSTFCRPDVKENKCMLF